VLVDRDDFRQEYAGADRRTYVPGQYDELRLSQDVAADVLLVRGKYRNRYFHDTLNKVVESVDAYLRYMRHGIPPQFQNPVFARENQGFDGKPRWTSLPCSAGPAGDGPCRPCSIPSAQTRAKSRFVFTVIHLANYHVTPSKRDAARTYLKQCLEVFDKDCPGCKADYPIVSAARRWLSISGLDWEIIGETNLELKKNCLCGGALKTTKLVCGSCGDDLIVRTPENKEDFRRARKDGKFYCRKCGIAVGIREWRVCNQCGNPRPRDVFNSVLTLKTVKKENYSQVAVTGNKPAGELLDQLKDTAVPLDLAAMFSPRSLKEQAAILNLRKADEGMSEER
jgi:hypothetical protein